MGLHCKDKLVVWPLFFIFSLKQKTVRLPYIVCPEKFKQRLNVSFFIRGSRCIIRFCFISML